MTQRPPIPKRLRFDVFKRDSFTCKYCGAKAPDVLLHCDHIIPVVQGGPTDMLNLTTSCSACNFGKGAVPLSDTASIEQQRDGLDELEERRQQIVLMLEWRDTLKDLDEETIDLVAERMCTGNWRPNENGRADIARWLKRATVAEVLQAWDDAVSIYAVYDDGTMTPDSWGVAFNKVRLFIDLNKQAADKPYLRRVLYIQGIIRKRSRAKRYQCVEYLEHLVMCGADLDEMERRAKRISEISDFEAPYDNWLARIGRPF